jgi:hypothetical protein
MGEREKPDTGPERGLNRRDLIRRGAIVGGAAVWATPIMQSLAAPAFGQASPLCAACLSATFDPDGPGPQPPITQHIIFTPTQQCCACVAANGGGLIAVVLCAISGDCSGITGPNPGPCP